MKKVIEKTVNLNLVGVNANAFALMAAFRRQARKEKWTTKEIEAVLDHAKSGDYTHLLATIINHCEAQES